MVSRLLKVFWLFLFSAEILVIWCWLCTVVC